MVLLTEPQTKQPQVGQRAGRAWLFSGGFSQTPVFGKVLVEVSFQKVHRTLSPAITATPTSLPDSGKTSQPISRRRLPGFLPQETLTRSNIAGLRGDSARIWLSNSPDWDSIRSSTADSGIEMLFFLLFYFLFFTQKIKECSFLKQSKIVFTFKKTHLKKKNKKTTTKKQHKPSSNK